MGCSQGDGERRQDVLWQNGFEVSDGHYTFLFRKGCWEVDVHIVARWSEIWRLMLESCWMERPVEQIKSRV